MPSAVPQPENDVAARIAQQTLAARAPDYSGEVRRLLDAGREVMRRNGTASRAKVADIVAAAGLSNEAFYRHFRSKDVLVAAILEDGTERLRSYLVHQMAKADDPAGQVRRWVEGILAQARDEDVAATTMAVLWNAGGTGDRLGSSAASAPLGDLLVEPLTAVGSDHPELHASLAGHAAVGALADHLWAGTRPSKADVDRITAFVLGGAAATR
ncbi:MAG TPA: helix-turn-helix domain-containing protein [Acidimicrobiales bacterium]|nr:helix-turn-helix domain-containing protein [Acidimicrobiales bacterium]